MLTIVLL